jgi:hypothetical protein
MRNLECNSSSGFIIHTLTAFIMTSLYYRPSGRVPASAPFVVALYALATLPFGWVYAWLMIHVPTPINLLCTLVFPIWPAYLSLRGSRRAKVRNPEWTARFGVAIGLAGWYFQWAAWTAIIVHMVAERPEAYPLLGTFIGMVLHPGALLDAVIEAAKVGTWSLNGHRITGAVLALFWLGELGMMLLFPYLFGRQQAEEPFCEASNTWAVKVDVPRKFAFINDPHTVPSFLEHHPRDLLSVLAPWSESVSLSYAKVTIHRCHGADSYLSISNVAAALVKGKIEESATPVVEYLRLPGIDPDVLIRELMDAVRRPPEAATKAEEVPVPQELEGALDHLNAERFEAAFAAAAPYVKSDQTSLRTDANRLCALASSRLERWEVALEFWQTLFGDEPTAHNALQVATSSVMAGDVNSGSLWMERARALNTTSRDTPRMTMETSFITALTESGQVHAAMPCLEEIRKFYVEFGVTDPTVLYMNQCPRFDVFLDKSAPIVRANLDAEQGRRWYASMLPHLDERGKLELDEWMKEQLLPG